MPACVLHRKRMTREPPVLAPPRTRRTPWRRPRRHAAAGGRSGRGSASALFLRSKRLSRTLLWAGQKAPTLSYGGQIPWVICMEREEAPILSYEGLIPSVIDMGGRSWPVAENLSYRFSATKFPILMPSPQSGCSVSPFPCIISQASQK